MFRIQVIRHPVEGPELDCALPTDAAAPLRGHASEDSKERIQGVGSGFGLRNLGSILRYRVCVEFAAYLWLASLGLWSCMQVWVSD